MKNGAMVAVIVLGIFLGAGFSHPSFAQSAVGGAAKPKQNAVGGAATPGPVVGGAAKQGSVGSTTKPISVGGVTKQGSVGGTPTPGSTGGVAKQNLPVVQPNKGGPVITTSSTLKCAAGSCNAKGTKP